MNIEEKLRQQLANNRKTNQHSVVGIQGPPGIGKSTLGLGLALGIDPAFSVDNVYYRREGWEAIAAAPKGGIFVLDEGNNVASSRQSMHGDQTRLMQLLNMIRQRNHTLIWATPNIQRIDIIVREDLLTHRINCFPHNHRPGAKVQRRGFDRDGQQSGWVTWPGILRWPKLEGKHPIWTEYSLNKEKNFKQSASRIGRYGNGEVDIDAYTRALEEDHNMARRRARGKARSA